MRRRIAAGLVLLAALGAAAWGGARAAAPRGAGLVDLDVAPSFVAVHGVPRETIERLEEASADERAEILTVRSFADGPPMLGAVEVRGDAIRFLPRFPFEPGLRYSLRLGSISAAFVLPRAAAPPTVVAGIHPTSGVLPANQLKFYVTFSGSMSVGEARRRVRLLDGRDREVARAFLHPEEELWDAARRRLTLILDPGRIKQGLRANLEDGAPLAAGAAYRLVVDGGWTDGRGRPLAAPFEKRFRVAAADRTLPDPAAWSVDAPAAGSVEPLRLRFDEPLDFVLLQDSISVVAADGRTVGGRVGVPPRRGRPDRTRCGSTPTSRTSPATTSAAPSTSTSTTPPRAATPPSGSRSAPSEPGARPQALSSPDPCPSPATPESCSPRAWRGCSATGCCRSSWCCTCRRWGSTTRGSA